MTIKTKKMRSRKNKTIEKKKLLDTERKWNIYSSVPINTYFKNKARKLGEDYSGDKPFWLRNAVNDNTRYLGFVCPYLFSFLWCKKIKCRPLPPNGCSSTNAQSSLLMVFGGGGRGICTFVLAYPRLRTMRCSRAIFLPAICIVPLSLFAQKVRDL